MAVKRKRRQESSLLSIFIQMFLIVAAIVVCGSLLFKDFGKDDPSATPIIPPETTVPPDTSGTIPPPPPPTDPPTPEQIFEQFMAEHGLTREDYTERQLEAYTKSPEAREFIMSIPLEKDKTHVADISGFDRTQGVPLYMQWDPMWAYHEYAYDLGGVTGCGPTCLSMVAYYLTGNTEYTPSYMMDLSTRENCVGETGGTEWILFSRASAKVGLKAEELPLYDGILIKRVQAGCPVVINVGPGDFTTTGHYVVIVGYADGYFKINDPNSVANSEKQWTYEQLEPQINNLWAFTLAE